MLQCKSVSFTDVHILCGRCTLVLMTFGTLGCQLSALMAICKNMTVVPSLSDPQLNTCSSSRVLIYNLIIFIFIIILPSSLVSIYSISFCSQLQLMQLVCFFDYICDHYIIFYICLHITTSTLYIQATYSVITLAKCSELNAIFGMVINKVLRLLML